VEIKPAGKAVVIKELFMKNSGFLLVLLLLTGLLIVFSMGSCATSGTAPAPWSEYTAIPDKDYTVVGIVVIRFADPRTVSTDLMEEAKKIGAHDIINVRIDTNKPSFGKETIVAASAVAIKYTGTILPPDFEIVGNAGSGAPEER
jgi:hypothetical protein